MQAITTGDLKLGAMRPEEERRAKDQARRELAASVIEKRYPKVADSLRAGMRSSTWPENLIDPGCLLDLLEKIEGVGAAEPLPLAVRLRDEAGPALPQMVANRRASLDREGC